MKVSIITPCFNSSKTIRKTIESILKQENNIFEYIVIDGGSSDGTQEIVESFRKKFEKKSINLILKSESDKGIYDAMNKGIVIASGDIIGILNSDDFYEENSIQHIAEFFKKEKNTKLIVNGYMKRIDEAGRVTHRYMFKDELIEQKKYFGHPTMFVGKEAYKKVGLYDIGLKLAADGDWQFRAYNLGIKKVIAPYFITNFREGGASDSFRYRWVWFKEIYEIYRRNKKKTSIGCFFIALSYVIKIYAKNILPKSLIDKIYERRKD